MEIYIPIGIVILAFFLGMIFLKEAYSDKKIRIGRLIYVGTIIIAYLLLILVFNDLIKESKLAVKIFNWIHMGVYALLALSYFVFTVVALGNKHIYDYYLKCVENEKLFIFLGKNHKIKAVSTLFAVAFENNQKAMIGKNFFEYFDDAFTVSQINGQSYTNEGLKAIFAELKKSKTEDIIKREIKVYDKKSRPYVLSFMDYVIVKNGKYKGHILIGDAKTGEKLLSVEAELEEKRTSLENIGLKFTTYLELTKEGLFFYNIDQEYFWFNDVAVKELRLNGNSVSKEAFLALIHPNDLEIYKSTFSELTPQKPNYEIKYQFRNGASYAHVVESGRRLFDSTSNEIMGYIEVLNSVHYEKTNISSLDSMKSMSDLMEDLNKLYQAGRTFELVTVRIKNIPEINETYGRDIGNLAMAEYIAALKKSFIDEDRFYRVSGLEFVFIMTDFRKMDLLSKGLSNNLILGASKTYGSVTVKMDVYMGIAQSNDAYNPQQLIDASSKSLKTALLDQVRTNYIYYKDIK